MSSRIGVQPGVRPALVDAARPAPRPPGGRPGTRAAPRARGRRRRRTRPARHSGRVRSRSSKARKPRSRFFDSSMRSTRTMSWRSPTASSRAASSCGALLATPPPSRCRRGRRRPGRRRSAGRAPSTSRAARPRRRRPTGWRGSRRRGGRPGPAAARRRRRSGSTRSAVGSQNGVWLKCTAAQVGAGVRPAARRPARGGSPARARPRPRAPPRRRASAKAWLTRAVRVPRLPPAPVDAGPAGQVEQAVVQEPQRGVGDHVVGHAVLVGVDRQRPHAEALGLDDPLLGRLAVGVGHGGRDPGRAAGRRRRARGSTQPAGAPLGLQLAVVVPRERDGPAVRHDDDRLQVDAPASAAPYPACPIVVAAPTSSGGRRPRPRSRPPSARGRVPAGWTCDEAPVADGGEGTARRPGRRATGTTTVTGPARRRPSRPSGALDGDTAVIEMARASGLAAGRRARGQRPAAGVDRPAPAS